MSIDSGWKKLILEQLKNASVYPGVFELSLALQDILYIGHMQSLAQAIQLTYERGDPDFNIATFFRFQTTNQSEAEYNKLQPINLKKYQANG